MGEIHDLLVGCLVLLGVAIGAWIATRNRQPEKAVTAEPPLTNRAGAANAYHPPKAKGPDPEFKFEVHKPPPPKAPFAIDDAQRAEMEEWEANDPAKSRWVDSPVSERTDPW